MRKVCIAWAVITLVMVSAAFAQRPEGRPPFMNMGVIHNCRVSGPGSNALACRCYMTPEGATCNVLPKAIMARMDSMREGRRDSMMGRRMGGRMSDSMRMRMRDSMMRDSTHRPLRMGQPRRP